METWLKAHTTSQLSAPANSTLNPVEKTVVNLDSREDSVVEINDSSTIQDQMEYIQQLEKKVKDLNRRITQSLYDVQHYKQLADTLKRELEESRLPPDELKDGTSLRQELESTKKQLLEAQSQVDLTNKKFARMLDELHEGRKRVLTAEDELHTIREKCSDNILQINSIETQLK